MWRDRLRSEDGLALIYTLFAVLILGGLAVLFVTRVFFETRATGQARDREAAIHVSEASAGEIVAEINDEGDTFAEKVITTDPDGNQHVYDPGSLTGEALEDYEEDLVIAFAKEEWDRAQSDSTYRNGTYRTKVLSMPEGDSFAVRPRTPSPQDAAVDIILTVGFVPSIDDYFAPPTSGRATARVITQRFEHQFYSPDNAILTAGDLELGGSASILAEGCDPSAPTPTECNADVHSNGDISVSGSAHVVEGSLTATGSISGSVTTVGGSQSGGEEEQPVPDTQARDFYNRPERNDDPMTNEEVGWYDLCRPGEGGNVWPHIRAPSDTGPCTGTVLWEQNLSATDYRGWTYNSTANRWTSNSVDSGIYYVYQADARVNGTKSSSSADSTAPARAVTILVEGAGGTLAGSSGSLQLTGNPKMVAGLPEVVAVTDRDLKFKGSGSGGQQLNCEPTCSDTQQYTGYFFVGEQMAASGNVVLEGAAIVEDSEDVHGLVTRNTDGISGNMTLDFDPSLKVDLTGKVLITFWNELD